MPTGLHSIKYVIEAVDKVTGVYNKIINKTGEVAKKHDVVNAVIRKTQASLRLLGNAVQGVERRFLGMARKAKEGIGKVVNSLGGLGTAIAGAFTMREMVRIFNSLTQAASDLNGAMSLSESTFGKSFTTIDKFSKQAVDSLGMSRREVYRAANGFGDYFKSLGYGADQSANLSTASIRLAQDLSSARGMTNEEGLSLYSDAIKGNVEAAKRLGVVLDDTNIRQRALDMGLIKSAKDAIPSYVRSQAAMAEIIEQTSSVQGHFIKNKDNDINATKRLTAAQEDLRAKLGEGLLPLKVKLLGVLNSTVKWVDENTERFQMWGRIILGVAGTMIGMYMASKLILSISGAYKAMSFAIGLVRNSTLLATIAQAAFNAVAAISPFGWIGLVIGGIILLSDQFAGLRAKLMTFFEPVKKVFLKAFNWIYDNVLKPMFGFLGGLLGFDISKPKVEKSKEADLLDEGLNGSYVNSSLLAGGKKAGKDVGVKKGNASLVSGAGKEIKNINIRIDKLVESLNINTTSLGMSTSQIKGEIQRVLLSAVNEVNYQ